MIAGEGIRPSSLPVDTQLRRAQHVQKWLSSDVLKCVLTLYRMVMPIGTPFLKEKINN